MWKQGEKERSSGSMLVDCLKGPIEEDHLEGWSTFLRRKKNPKMWKKSTEIIYFFPVDLIWFCFCFQNKVKICCIMLTFDIKNEIKILKEKQKLYKKR